MARRVLPAWQGNSLAFQRFRSRRLASSVAPLGYSVQVGRLVLGA